ncbi:MAG: cysteine desulfurase [Clostridia bacterium]|nr:cysteine desulfurase [Clostridia bacterium]
MNTVNKDPLDVIQKLANELFMEEKLGIPLGSYDELNSMASKSQSLPQSFKEAPGITQAARAVETSEGAYYFLRHLIATGGSDGFKQQNTRLNDDLDVEAIRKDFPILHKRLNGRTLVWLDNGATTQKPACVMDKLNDYYRNYNSNVHRGAHTLSKLSTQAYEKARETIRDFIGATASEEIIFVRGATEAINLVAETYGRMVVNENDKILVTQMEHHSNIVPWQSLAREKGATLEAIPFDDRGDLLLEEYERLLTPNTKIVALTHVSNVLGTVNPIRKMIEMAREHGACVLIDGAQSAPHLAVDVRELDCDFFVLSGHKAYGPTGIGVLYGKKSLLEKMPPWQKGGGMIKQVSFSKTVYNGLPHKFEAGTGNIADAIGLGAAIEYMKGIGMRRIEQYEKNLTDYAMDALSQIRGLKLIGTSQYKTCALSFILDGYSPDRVAQHLNTQAIAVRSGHHCAQPALQRFGLESSVRASIGVYNTYQEIRELTDALLKLSH